MITNQSDSQILVVLGQPATFTVTATGDNLMYQWQKDGSDIDGANSATYAIAAIAERDEGMYQCVVSNAANSVTSIAASLTVCKCVSDYVVFYRKFLVDYIMRKIESCGLQIVIRG